MNTIWHGCYDESWKGEIVDEAFSHPAKCSRGLIRRIFDYLDMPRDSVVVDPFGGVGTTGIESASRGLRFVIGCELEAKFVELAKQNFELHRRTWEAFGDPLPIIEQGDSRELSKVLVNHIAAIRHVPSQVDCVVGSPPYASSNQDYQSGYKYVDLSKRACGSNQSQKQTNYGTTPGQLGGLKAGSVDAVVSSPPYEGSQVGTGTGERSGWRGYTDIAGGVPASERGQLSGMEKETFWSAARDIATECHAILKPNGLAVFVCKDFVRKGQRVPFSADWVRLCESCGFELVEWIHASLVKEHRHPDLFGGDDIVKVTERKSFFRRLAEKKGSPAIDHEDVLVMRAKP